MIFDWPIKGGWPYLAPDHLSETQAKTRVCGGVITCNGVKWMKTTERVKVKIEIHQSRFLKTWHCGLVKTGVIFIMHICYSSYWKTNKKVLLIRQWERKKNQNFSINPKEWWEKKAKWKNIKEEQIKQIEKNSKMVTLNLTI